MKILFPTEQIEIRNDFEAFEEVVFQYGTKSAGLMLLPSEWRPPFIAVATDLYEKWQSEGTLDTQTIDEIMIWISDRKNADVIVRTSGAREIIGDRGKYESERFASTATKEEFTELIQEMFRKTQQIDPTERLALVIQEYLEPSILGHLSNEVRISPTRNQWKYEIELPTWSPMKGINSTFAPLPDPQSPLTSGASNPHQSLRSLGKWITENIKTRCHIEWLCKDDNLWLVQTDLEWGQHDNGMDPTVDEIRSEYTQPKVGVQSHLTQYQIGSDTKWKKLKNLSEFDFESVGTGPVIHLLSSDTVIASENTATTRRSLIDEISMATGNRVVVRTDCCQPDARVFNLPRTDTVTAEEAVSWCVSTLSDLEAEGIRAENVAFLCHAFLPATASAWAYASANSPTVFVDALWGLPDGLQVLPVDSYEVNVPQGKIIATKSTYKPRFLCEKPDGTWVYENILRSKGRSRVLAKSDILEIATRTQNISNKLSQDAQLMWFSGIPEEFSVGRNLPWFRSREHFQEAPRIDSRYPPYDVRKPSDLEKLPDRNATIRLSPRADLIRDDHFLQKVIDKAKENRLPVLLEGSSLGHIYYRLCEEGIGIVLANAPKYHRKRDKRVFGKIVRDKIPDNILAGGETVSEAVLEKGDFSHGLAGKFIEELEEFLLATSSDEQVSELADIFEVIQGMAKNSGVNWEDVVSFANRKRSRSGAFFDRRVLLETSLPVPKKELGRIAAVGIDQLGIPVESEETVRIPVTALMNTIGRNSFHFFGSEFGDGFRMRIKGGQLEITRVEKTEQRQIDTQLGLFDEK